VVSAESAAVERRVTGLLNRLSEANLAGIVSDVKTLFSAGRRLVSDTVISQILGAASTGPRATEQFAAVAAAFIALLAASVDAPDLAARWLEGLAFRLDDARSSGDSIAQHNLVVLLAFAYVVGLVGSPLLFSFLSSLLDSFQEADVAAMADLLGCCGLKLRGDDPTSMKDFVLAVNTRTAAVGPDGLSKRAKIMLELVVDIKNNRSRAVAASAKAEKAGTIR
jgi:nucleolar MIF4G domain-containing protein 1